MNYVKLEKVLGAGALALCVTLASQASAATVNFATGGNGTAAGGTIAGGPSYTTSAAAGNALFAAIPATVTQSGNGLGVRHFLDAGPGQIDAYTGYETLTITFARAVNLVNFTLGLLDDNDDLEVSFDGGATFTHIGPGLANPIAGANYVSSFAVRALRGAGDGLFIGNDDFTLKSANIASVPVPAAGLMLLAGLGGLGALRRKRKTA